MKIKTNNVPRELLHWHDLTDAQRADHSEEDQTGYFFMYRNYCYPLAWFMGCAGMPGDALDVWDGQYPESGSSGVVFRLDRRSEDYVIVGTYTY